MSDLETLKKTLREDDMPMFTDGELEELLKTSGSLDEAIYEGAIMKSENTSLTLQGMSIADTSSYFLRIARLHRSFNSGVV